MAQSRPEPVLAILATNKGRFVLGPARIISRNVTDFRLSNDGSAVVFSRRVGPHKLEVAYADVTTGTITILVRSREADQVRFGTEFAFVGKTNAVAFTVDPGPWRRRVVQASIPPMGWCDVRRTVTLFRCSQGTEGPQKLNSIDLGPGSASSMDFAEGGDKAAVLFRGAPMAPALCFVGPAGPARRVEFPFPVNDLMYWDVRDGEERLRMVASVGKREAPIDVRVHWKTGQMLTRSMDAGPSPSQPTKFPDEPEPSGQPVESHEIRPWRIDDLPGPSETWRFYAYVDPPFGVLGDGTLYYEGPRGLAQLKVAPRMDRFKWSPSGTRLAILGARVLSIRRIEPVRR